MALALFGVVMLVLRSLAGMFARGPGHSRRNVRDASGAARAARTGELVRDRVCNTFLPRERAIGLTRSGETHFFCSEDCRTRFIAGATRGIDAA
ncbi:MAG TPA: hypothetical protein VFE84_05480 [Patescibacteria group bacterium]|nr:hypothetical protein [Patescibacteria group bacterium]